MNPDNAASTAKYRSEYLEWGLLAALMIIAYAPVYARMIVDWYNDPNYSHGFLVPLVSAWLVYESRDTLRAIEPSPSTAGFAFVLAGLALLTVGTAVSELFTTRISSLLLLTGIIHVLFGREILRVLAPALAFLVFMVPLPYTIYDMLSLPLKHMVSWMAAGGIKACGLPVLREGNMILFPNISLEVVEACSGLRSLVSLMALGAAYAFLMLKKNWQRIVLVLATIPIAVLTNALRVFITGILARYVGAGAAEGFFHNFAGLAVFFAALVLTALCGHVLGKLGKPKHTPPTGANHAP